MAEFIGRDKQLRVLADAWEGSRSSFIPIYGRRRVGKSELILHFLRGRPALYYLGKKAPAGLQIREFLKMAAAVLEEPLLATFPANRWSDALDAVLARRSAGTKIALVFDEFQWIVEASPELPSFLQERWDREWQHSGDVLLIVCGSYVGFMEREVLGRRSPLFGRRTAQILLRPFDYREAAGFHTGYSLVDRARTYFLCGGIPYYLRAFSDRRSFEMNLATQLLDEHAVLFREPDFLLREELREVEKYYAVLLAVAGGHTTGPDVARVSGTAPGSLPYYLKQLIELGYLVRRYPLTGEGRNLRQVHYDFGDPLLRFWFRFIFPEQSQLLRLGPERALRERIRPRLDAYFGHCFERLCREALPRLYEREGVQAAFEIGEYWSRETQIDVVGLRADGWTDLGECKWGAVRSAAEVERQLEEKVKSYPNRRNATLGRRIFARRKRPVRRAGSSGVRWHTLEELYE
ncbi:MAG: ATP-binding protein [bacterium]|nr:ATP-binding protein [bacterium]